jgi:hypothetical protein
MTVVRPVIMIVLSKCALFAANRHASQRKWNAGSASPAETPPGENTPAISTANRKRIG